MPGRIYNAGDDVHMKMADCFDMVADHYGLPHSPRISWEEAQQHLSPALLSFPFGIGVIYVFVQVHG